MPVWRADDDVRWPLLSNTFSFSFLANDIYLKSPLFIIAEYFVL